jgi:CDGSH-type Zn-finger protein
VELGELVEPVLEPTAEPVLAPAPPAALPEVPPAVPPVAPALLPALPPALPPAAPPAPPPDCAHDTLATATNAEATATAIALTITVKSPWSIEEDCTTRVARAVPGTVVSGWRVNMADRPRIACLPNGPYYLLNDMQASPVENLERSSGAKCTTVRGVALCRCGGSKTKPFCDGTHSTNGFSDRKLADRKLDHRDTYPGKRITIFDNRAICAHAGLCTDSLKSVFLQGEEPWIDADGAAVDEIISTIRKCPSGALSYAIDGVEAEAPSRRPKVVVTDNGPYAVSGGIELMNVQFGDGASREHYTLCRCGASGNKPFCDGSHWKVEFRDP